jgi:hypothetical protein
MRPGYLRKRNRNNGGSTDDFSPYWNFKTSLKPKTTDRIFHITYVQRSQIRIIRQAKKYKLLGRRDAESFEKIEQQLEGFGTYNSAAPYIS